MYKHLIFFLAKCNFQIRWFGTYNDHIVSGTLEKYNLEILIYNLSKKSIKHIFLVPDNILFTKFASKGKKKQAMLFFTSLHSFLTEKYTLDDAISHMLVIKFNYEMLYILIEIKHAIRQGRKLSSSLKNSTKYFTENDIMQIHLGEMCDELTIVLDKLTNRYTREMELIQSVLNASYYPLILLVTAIAIIYFFIHLIIPNLVILFKDINTGIPPNIQHLITLKNTIHYYGKLLNDNMIITIIICLIFPKTSGHTKYKIRFILTHIVKHIPYLHSIKKYKFYRNFFLQMDLLLSTNFEIIFVLDVIINNETNLHSKKKLLIIKKGLLSGDNLVDALKKSTLFSKEVIDKIYVTSKTKSIEVCFKNLALEYENKIIKRMCGLLKLLEPTILVLVTIIVGNIIINIYLPLLDIPNMY